MRRNSKILAMFLVLIMLGGMFLSACGQSPRRRQTPLRLLRRPKSRTVKRLIAGDGMNRSHCTSQEVKLVMYLLGELDAGF